MKNILPLLLLLAANASADIYSNCDGYTFSETALLSAPGLKADTLAVLSPGIQVTLFGHPARNDSTGEWCKVSTLSAPGTVGFVRIIDLALTYKFDPVSEIVLMYGFSDSGEGSEGVRSYFKLTRNGRIIFSRISTMSTMPDPEDWNFNYRGCFIQMDESRYESASAVFIMHFPTRASDLLFEKMVVVITDDSTIVTGPSILGGLVEENFDVISYFVSPGENLADNLVNSVAVISEHYREEGELQTSFFLILRSVWNGSEFDHAEEHITLTLPENTSSYLTREELEPFRCGANSRILGYQILNYPDPLLPPGAEEIELIPVSFSTEPTDFTSIIIAFAFPEGWLPLDTLLLPGSINSAKLYGQWTEGTGTLNLYPCGAMSSSYPISTWGRDNEWKFSLISEQVCDAAEVAYAAMDSLLAEEDIEGAKGWLNYILMSRMGDRTHAEMAVQFFYPTVSACMNCNNGMQPLEDANRALSLMDMHNWFIEIPSQGREAYLESEFARYINIGNLQEG
ncbi:MAG: hypothetical protein KAH31_04555, partial [Candidatus Sabulitectum sp.]|nr:hypothetical protein [Candidatus Sabulitectum sp.]